MKKNFFFRIFVENVLIFVFFWVDFEVHTMPLIGQASLLNCIPSVWETGGRNSAPFCACREMSQRLTRAPSNCGKS